MFPFRRKDRSSHEDTTKKEGKSEKSEKKSEWVMIFDPSGRPCWQHAESGHVTYGNSFAAPQQGYNPAMKAQKFLLESPPDSPKASKSEAAPAPAHNGGVYPTYLQQAPTSKSEAAPAPAHNGGVYPPYLQQAPMPQVPHPHSPVSQVPYPHSPVSPIRPYPHSPVSYMSPVLYAPSPVAVYPVAPWNMGVMPASPVPQQVPIYLREQSTEAEKEWKKKMKDKKEKELREKEANGTWDTCYDNEGNRYWKNSASGRKRNTDPYY